MIIILPTAAVFSENAYGDVIYGLKGNGTVTDPYLISSADDLLKVSDLYHFHDGAYYKQTRDIIFDDDAVGGYKISMNISVTDGEVIVHLSTDVPGTVITPATVWLNGQSEDIYWDDGFPDVRFDIGLLNDKNIVTAAGTVGDERFAITASLSGDDVNISLSAPLKGNFRPIGSADLPFSGVYDGNGYSVIGMKAVAIGSEDVCNGLFGHTDKATIINTSIISEEGNASYVLTNITDKITSEELIPSSLARMSFSGSIVGHGTADTSVISCYSDATVFSNLIYDRTYVYTSGVTELKGRLSDVNVVSSTGGIAGFGVGTIYDVENAGNVISLMYSSVRSVMNVSSFQQNGGPALKFDIFVRNMAGGIIGHSDDITLSASGNSGGVSAVSNISVYVGLGYNLYPESTFIELTERSVSVAGGIAGSLTFGTVSDVYNAGQVSSSCTVRCDTVKRSDNPLDEISITFRLSAGGILGAVFGGSGVKRAHNIGYVAVGGGTAVYETMNNDTIQKENGRLYAGEIIGSSDDVYLEDCYFMERPMNHTAVGNISHYFATKLKKAEMASGENFPKWDLERLWAISGEGYPEIWIRYDMTITDVSASFIGHPRYSVDNEHSFDDDGVLFSYTDKRGPVIILADRYKRSEITVYAIFDDKKLILERDIRGNYRIPSLSLLDASSISLYIDGNWIETDGGGEDIGDTDDLPNVKKADAEGPAFIFVLAFTAFGAAITLLNAVSARSIITCAVTEEEGGEHEQAG